MQEMSASQFAMLSDQVLDPGHVGTVLTATVIAEYAATADQLRRAWVLLCERLPALRDHVVPSADGFAIDHGTGELVTDIRHVSDVRSAAVRRDLAVAGVTPFDLDERNLVRLNARTDGRHIVVSVVVHHVLMDVTSALWVHSDYSGCVREIVEGDPATIISSGGGSFAGYVAAESSFLRTPAAELHRGYWRSALDGYRTDLLDACPTGVREVGAVTSDDEAEHWVRIECDGVATEGIRARAREWEVSASALLLTVYMRLLASATDSDDIAVLVPVLRRGEEYATTLGTFTESVVVRAMVGGPMAEDSVAVAAAFDRAREYGDLPLAEVAAQTPRPDLLMRTSFLYEPSVLQHGTAYVLGDAFTIPFPGYRVDPFPVPGQVGQFPFRMQIGHLDGRYIGALHYDPRRFAAGDVRPLAEEMVSQLTHITRGAGRVDLPDSGERASGWRHPGSGPAGSIDVTGLGHARPATGPADLGPDRAGSPSVLDRVREVVERTPDAVAVSADGQSLTYADLWSAAGSAATLLDGAPPGEVAVFLPKSTAAVAAMVGVLRAGRHFVVIDPAYPDSRRDVMFSEGARTAVTDPGHAALVPSDVAVVTLPALTRRAAGTDSAGACGDQADVRLEPGTPAYSVFTSGSTGRPKRVLISHDTLLRSTSARESEYAAGPERFLHLSSLSFDSAYAGLFWTLVTGGELVLVDMSRQPSPADLAEVIRHSAVSHLLAVPSLYEAILETVDPGDLASLRQVIVAGEECRRGVVDAHFRALGSAGLANEYGPAEGTIWASVAHLTPGGDVTIGATIPGVEAVLLDEQMREVRTGEPAELHLAGNLAIGYVGRARETAASFVPDPRPDGARRLYRTGDLVSRGPDGRLRFHGRIDDQFKINGFRVEPQEIEAAHFEATGGTAVAVPVGPRVVLLVESSDPGAEADRRAELRATAALLPGYMAPARIVPVDRFPRSVNGKVDRHAAVELGRRVTGTGESAMAAGTTGHREILVATVARLLGGETSADTDFLSQGGDSITAMKVVGALRSEGLKVEPRALLGGQPLGQVAAGVVEVGPARTPSPGGTVGVVDPAPTDTYTDTDIPLSRRQRAMLLQSWAPGADGVYVEQFVLELDGPVDTVRLADAWRQVFRTHPLLAARVRDDGDALDLSRPDLVEITTDTEESSSRERADALERDRRRGFPEAGEPLSRVRISRRAGGVCCVWTHHHAVADGWSLPIIGADLARAYRGRGLDRPVADPAVMARAVLERERDRARAVGVAAESPGGRLLEAMPEVGSDGPAEPTRTLTVPTDIDEIAGRYGVTVAVLVNAVWSLALARTLGLATVSHGLVTSGRDLPVAGVEGAVGLFISTSPVSCGWAPEADVSGGLDAVGDGVITAMQGDGPTATGVDSIVVIENYPLDASALDFGRDITVGGVDLVENTEFPLVLQVRTYPAMRVDLHVDPRRVPSAAARSVAGHVEQIFADASAEIAVRPVAHHPAPAPSITAPDPGGPDPGVVPGLLDTVVAHAADSAGTALVAADGTAVDYGRLVTRYRQIADDLAHAGVRPGDVVAVEVGGDTEPVSTLLAVLETGATWLVLDATLPEARRTRAIEASGAGWLVEVGPGGRVEPVAGPRDETAPGELTDDLLAYVIFTSGTTGEPKCIAVNRRELYRHLDSVCGQLDYRRDDVVLVFGSLMFDASLEQVLGALWSGATAVFRPQELLEPQEMSRFLARHGVTLFNPPTGYFRRFVTEVGSAGWPTCTRTVVVGGEALPGWSTRERRRAGVRVINAYGPTEAVITALTHDVGRRVDVSTHPIGRPFGPRGAYVLGEDLRPVSPGIIGQLYLSGPLAIGYLGDATDTASAFLPDPYAAIPGTRMYATGDLVVADEMGQITFLSRADRQLKIRGYRVDPAEVEAAVHEVGGRSARAFAVPGAGGATPELVCAVVRDPEGPGGEESTTALRATLRHTLPAHLVPGRIVVVESIPLTRNGKIDDAALRATLDDDPDTPAVPGTGHDPAARFSLAAGWGRILGRGAAVGGFLAAGGDSLKALEFTALMRRQGILIDAAVLMSDGSLTDVENAAIPDPAVNVTGHQPAVSTELPPAVHWFRRRVAVDSVPESWNMAVRIETDSVPTRAHVDAAAREVLRVHPMLRATLDTGGPWSFVLDDCEPLVLNVDSADVGWARRRLFNDLGRRVGATRRAIGFGVHRDHARAETSILVMAHHLMVDIVSLNIIVDDLIRALLAADRGESSVLPPEATSVHEWAAWLGADERREMSATAVAAAYRGVTPRDAQPTGTEGDSVTARIDLGAERVASVVTATGLSAEEVLQLACARAAAAPDAGDVVLELETHGRELMAEGIDLSRTVGWFTALMPLPLSVGPMESMAAELRGRRRFLGRTGHTATSTYAPGVAHPVAGLSVDVGVNFAGRLPAGGGDHRVSMVDEGGLRAPGAPRPVRVAVDAWIDDDRFVANVQHVDPVELVAFCRDLDRAVDEIAAMTPIGSGPGWCGVDLAGNALSSVRAAAGGDVVAVAPLTRDQAGMFLRTETDPHGAYIEQSVLELSRGADMVDLADRVRRLGRSYPFLRACVVWDMLAEPVLVVPERSVVAVDRLGTGVGFGEPQLEEVAAAEITSVARSGGGCLFRALLLDSDRPRLVLTYHHLVVDGWTVRMLLDELSDPAVAGDEPDWRMHDHMIESGVRGHDTQLTPGARHSIRLPEPRDADAPDRPDELDHPDAQEHPGRPSNTDLVRVLDSEEVGTLRRWAAGAGVTLGTAVHVVWALTLAGPHDAVVVRFGSVRQTRDESQRDAPGMFLETVAVEAGIDRRAAVVELAGQLHAALHGVGRAVSPDGAGAALTAGPFDTAVIVDDDRGVTTAPTFLGEPVVLVSARERTGLPLTLSAVDSAGDGTVTLALNCDTTRLTTARGRGILHRVVELCRALGSGPETIADLTGAVRPPDTADALQK